MEHKIVEIGKLGEGLGNGSDETVGVDRKLNQRGHVPDLRRKGPCQFIFKGNEKHNIG